jgi:hypothetical protein
MLCYVNVMQAKCEQGVEKNKTLQAMLIISLYDFSHHLFPISCAILPLQLNTPFIKIKQNIL